MSDMEDIKKDVNLKACLKHERTKVVKVPESVYVAVARVATELHIPWTVAVKFYWDIREQEMVTKISDRKK